MLLNGGLLACAVRNREYQRASRDRLRQQFLDEYGRSCVGTADGEPCQWGVTDERALTVAHMNNDGGARRLELAGSWKTTQTRSKVDSSKVMRDLRKRGWPKDEGIATQCANCQLLDLRGGGHNGAQV